jgi:hypothetical protein
VTSPFIHYHFRLAILLPASARAHLERRARINLRRVACLLQADRRRGLGRAEPFNVSNTPPLSQPNGSFGAAAFGSVTTAGDPGIFVLAPRLKF